MNETTNNQPPTSSDDVNYTVMPNLSRKYTEPVSKPGALVPPSSVINSSLVEANRSNLRKWILAGGAVVLILLLGALAYYFINEKRNQKQPVKQSKLPKVWLNQHFGSESCTDENRCGDESDPDTDGLVNYNEFKEGTNPNKADSDEDGLADGDEINVYKTDPGLKYTDRREIAVVKDFNDSADIADNFDPLTPGLRMTEARLKQIEADTKTFGLHEPTITTLKNLREKNGAVSSKSHSVFIENNKLNPPALTINKGDTVVWLNKDSTAHQVVHLAGSNFAGFQSPKLETNQTFSFTFEVTGTFQYEDQLNKAIKGTVEVK